MLDILYKKDKALIFIFIVILIFGINAYINIPKELNPDIEIPGFNISIPYKGISAEDAEKLLAKPMERNLKSLEGLKNITSYSTNGHAFVYLEFNAGINTKKVLQDVRERVSETKADFPVNTDEPIISEFNFSLMPVVSVVLTGDLSQRVLNKIALDLKDELQEISEILEVNLSGYKDELLEILINPDTLQRYNLRISDIESVIRAKDQIITAGNIKNKNGNYNLRISGIIKNYEELFDLPIKLVDNKIVTLKEVAEIRSTFKDATRFSRVNGMNSIALDIVKRSGENVIETIEKVKNKIEQYQLPEQVKVIFSQDDSVNIESRLKELENNLLMAIILTVIPIIITMGIKSANLVAISIPGSFLLGVLYLYITGNSFNIVVLFGLILSIGMLVDATIVVCEYADRKIIEGVNYKKAYFISAKRMFNPIFSSTLTTLIVFSPLLFWPGLVGKFMAFLPKTVIATLIASFIVATIFIPVIGSFIGNKNNITNEMQKAINISEKEGDFKDLQGLNKFYYSILKFCLRKAGLISSLIILFLFITVIVFKFWGNGIEFFPAIEPDNLQVEIISDNNLSLDQKDSIIKKIEKEIIALQKEFKVIYTKIGDISSTGKNIIGKINIELVDWESRRKADDIIVDLRNRLSDISGVKFFINKEKKGPSAAKDIEIEITAAYRSLIVDSTKILYEYLLKDKDLNDVKNSLGNNKLEWEIEIDEKEAGLIGLSKNEIANAIKLISNGINLAKYRPDYLNYEVDINLRFFREYRNISTLQNLFIVNSLGKSVPIINAIKIIPKREAGIIVRENGKNIETITANVNPNIVVSNKIIKLKEEINKLNLVPGIKIKFTGDEKDQQETGNFLKNAFITALLLMLIILVLQFNSYYKAFIIMTAIFLSTGGVFLGLLITGQPFGMVMCGIGIIALAGIVVNNNIIFIDAFEELQGKNHFDIEETLIRTGLQRIRPILLTAGTTALGLLPMILGVSVDLFSLKIEIGAPSSQWWKQLSTTIAGGLSFATVLTLFFTPCLLKLGYDFSIKINNLRRNKWNRYK